MRACRMNSSYGTGFISKIMSLSIMRQHGKDLEERQYAFQVSRGHSSHLILPQVSTKIRLQGQEPKERVKFSYFYTRWL